MIQKIPLGASILLTLLLIVTGLQAAQAGTFRSIAVDGDPGDWAGIAPVIWDPVGDRLSPAYWDLDTLSVANDNESIYFLFKVVSPVPYPPETPLNVYLDLDGDPRSGCTAFGPGFEMVVELLSQSIVNGGQDGYIGDAADCGWTPFDFTGAVTVGRTEDYVEASVPLDILRSVNPRLLGIGVHTTDFDVTGGGSSLNHGYYQLEPGDDVGAPGEYLDITSIPDVNGNGASELAVLWMLSDGATIVTIKDGETRELLNEVLFENTDKQPLGVTPLLDISGNGAPELAVLFVRADGTGRVHIKDSATGQWLGKVNVLNPDWEAKAITSQDIDNDGVSEVSVLGVLDDGSMSAVQINDSLNGGFVNWVSFPVN